MTNQPNPLLEALENERRYVARELHDGIAQTTLQLGLQAGICRKMLERGMTDMLAKELAQLEGRIQLVSSQVRYIISDMRPPLVEADATLTDYIQYVIDIHTERLGPTIAYQALGSDNTFTLSPAQTLILFRIIQETLLNIRKHAQAEHVEFTLSTEGQTLQLTIIDDGKGFDLAKIEGLPKDKGGAGLTNMHHRAKAIGARLIIVSDPSAGGTNVTLVLPK